MRLPGRMRPLLRTAAVMAAFTMAMSASAASQAAGPAPAHRVGRAMSAPVLTDGPRALGGEPECFYTFPDCSSTDPTVMNQITNSGDTSSCTFKFDVDWGDGHSDSQTFQGSADDGTIATFTHTYDDKPASFPVTVTGEVLSNTDPSVTCTATGSNLKFHLTPAAGLVGLRFAAADADSLNTPGLPVIKDDGPDLTSDRGWGPQACDGIDDPTSFDYLNCGSPVPQGGADDKNWPVIFVAGSPLTISKVVFVANGKIIDPELTANASVRCDSGAFSFPVLATRPMTEKKAGDLYQLAAIKLTFTGANLPAGAGQCAIYVDWTVTEPSSGATITAGQEYHIVYLTAADYQPPNGFQSDEVIAPYESLVQIGSVAAAGKSGQKEVFDAIWKKFTSRDIAHPVLDPVTGQVSDGPTFKYYNDNYPTIADAFNHRIGDCPKFTWFLAHDVGHCGNFAAFLAGVLAFQGIASNAFGLGKAGAFNAGPDPEPGKKAFPYAYMLVGPRLWSFGRKNASGRYPYRDKIDVKHGQLTITGSAVSYKSGKPIAQGPVSDPPMLFDDGDHAVVNVLFTNASGANVVDPSYGNPKDPAPYPDLPAYEKSAIAGFAVIDRVVTKNGKITDSLLANGASLAKACEPATLPGERIACYFQAVPYA